MSLIAGSGTDGSARAARCSTARAAARGRHRDKRHQHIGDRLQPARGAGAGWNRAAQRVSGCGHGAPSSSSARCPPGRRFLVGQHRIDAVEHRPFGAAGSTHCGRWQSPIAGVVLASSGWVGAGFAQRASHWSKRSTTELATMPSTSASKPTGANSLRATRVRDGLAFAAHARAARSCIEVKLTVSIRPAACSRSRWR